MPYNICIGERSPVCCSLNLIMSFKQEKTFVAEAIDRLKGAGYTLRKARDGEDVFIIGENVPTGSAIDKADGTDLAWFELDSHHHSCTLFVTWGEGEDCIADILCDSFEELEKIERLIET